MIQMNLQSTTLDLSKKSGPEPAKRFSFLNAGSIEEQTNNSGRVTSSNI